MHVIEQHNLPIGVFDSGVGGLTVLRALRERLPGESFVYLGDTARLPYGTKTADTVKRYALQAAARLIDVGVKAIVVACNTASATALPELRQRFAPLPVYGVVEPGADAAAVSGGPVSLLATESTVRGGAYQQALLRRGVRVIRARAAPLMVAVAEEVRPPEAVETLILEHYLAGLVEHGESTLLLGCTHFPIFIPTIRRLLAQQSICVVDSASTTAAEVASSLQPATTDGGGGIQFFATDGASRFRRVGERFLGAPIELVSLVDV